jgi:hypothetical protein
VEPTDPLVLRGPLVRLGGRGSLAYQGMPQIVELANGVRRPPRGVTLQYARADAPNRWATLSGDVFGAIRLRAVSGGVLRLLESVRIVPPHLSIDLIPGRSPGPGWVCIRGARAAEVGVEPFPGGDAAVEVAQEGVRIRASWTGEAPDRLGLVLKFAGASSLRVDVPFPVERAQFADPRGASLAPGTLVSVEHLLRYRAEAFSAIDRGRYAYRIEARARVEEQTTGPWHHLADLRPTSGGWHELPLDTVEDSLRLRLATTDDLDAAVELRLVRFDNPRPLATVVIAQYDNRLGVVRDEDTHQPVAVSSDGVAMQGSVDVSARPVDDPARLGIDLEPAGPGRWHLPSTLGPGGWLVTATREGVSVARPIRLTRLAVAENDAPSDAPALSPLRRALRTPDADARREALDEALGALADAPNDADWAVVDAHMTTLGVLPATTFDLLRRLPRHPEVLALAALRAAQSVEFGALRRMNRLPFAWWLVPLRCWSQAADRFVRAQERVLSSVPGLDGPRLARESLTPFVTGAARIAPALRATAAYIGRRHGISAAVGDGDEFAVPEAYLRVALENARDELLRAHSEDDWPTDDISAAVGPLEIPPTRFDALRVDGRAAHRCAVADAPVVAALVAAYARSPLPLEALTTLRGLRAFDPVWFDDAYVLTVVRLTHLDPHIWT